MSEEIKIRKVNNILLALTVFYFLIIFNHLFDFIDFYEDIDNIYLYFLAYFFPIILTPFVYTFHKRIKTGKIFTIIFTIIAFLFSFFVVFIVFLKINFDFGKYSYNKPIYLSKYNKNKMIVVTRSGGGGAYNSYPDVETVNLLYDFPPILKYYKNIDTNNINLEDWIKLKFNSINNSSPSLSFQDIDFSELELLEDSDFIHLNIKNVDKIKLPKELSYKLKEYRWYYCKQNSTSKYNSYICFTEGDLILQTINKQYKGIDYIKIYSDLKFEDFNLKKTCYFENDSLFTINYYYETFELDENKIMIPNSLIKVNFLKRYLINYNGNIEYLSESELDEVKIILPD